MCACEPASARTMGLLFLAWLSWQSLSHSVLVGLWFKVTLSGLGWCFLSHATREVSVSEVDCTQTGQLVPDLCWITSIAVPRPR